MRRLGAGAHGTVYEVRDLFATRHVALKALWPEPENRTALVAALRAEFGVLASLRHPLLCRVYDFGRLPEQALGDERAGLFFTRELIDGVDLESAATQTERSPGAVCALVAQAARGLSALHQTGLRHGDFKPANAIVDPRGGVRLIDFGLAVGEATVRASGTLAYMAPEVLARREVDRRADLYALGVSLFQLCAGKLPSGARSGAQLVSWHLEGTRPALSSLVPNVPEALDRLVAQLLAPSVEDRVPSADEAATALELIGERLGERVARAREVAVPVMALAQVGALERAFGQRMTRATSGLAHALVELVGEEGGGKTSVLTEVSWRLQLAGAEVVRANSLGQGRPLGVIGSALTQLAALADTPLPVRSRRAAADSQVQHFADIARWLHKVSEKFAVVVLVDDLDFADSASQQLVQYLATALAPDARVLVIACRQPRPDEQPDDQVRAGDVPRVWLDRFSVDEVAQLLRRAAGRADSALAERVHRVTGGNLLHTAHVLRYLADRSFPPAHSLDALTLPPRLQQSALTLLANADELCRQMHGALAVLGRPAASDVVRAIVTRVHGPVAVDAFDEVIASARVSGSLVADSERQVRYARPALAHGVYGLLTDVERAGMHKAVGAVLVGQLGLGADDPVVVLHGVRAGDVKVARSHGLATVRALWAAGDHAAALALGAESVELLATREAEPSVDLNLAVGELARLSGDLERAEALLQPLTSAARIPVRDRAIYVLGCAYEEAGRPEAAIPLFDSVLDARPDGEHSPLIARALARLYIKRGRNDEALAVVDAALPHVAKPELARHLDVARAFITGALKTNPDAETQLVDHASAAMGDADDGLAATSYNYAALLAFRRGDYPAAQRLYGEALEPAQSDGDAVRVGTLRMNLASVAFHQGNYASCLQQHTAALSLLSAIAADTPATISRRNLGHLLVELGEYERARLELNAAAAAAQRLELDVHIAGCEALLGIVDCRVGDWQLGVAKLEAAATRFGELESPAHVAETLLDIAEVSLDAVGSGAETVVADALRRAESLDVTSSKLGRRARLLAYRAELAARLGETTGAELLAGLAEPIEELSRQGKRHAVWSLHRAAARGYLNLGSADRARDHRDQALALVDEMAEELPASQRAAFLHDPRRRWLRSAFTDVEHGTVPDTLPAATDSRVWRLIDIYRRMSSERDYRRLLDMVMQTAVELSGAERGFLLLSEIGDDGEAILRTAVSHNLSIAAVRALAQADSDPLATPTGEASYSRTIAERVFETGERVVSDNPRTDPRFDQAQSVHALDLQSVVCLPVHSRGAVVGVLYLEARYRRVEFSPADVQLLTAFGDQVAILLDNAKLLEENTSRASELGRAHQQIEELLVERTAMLDERTAQLAQTRRELATMRRRFLGDRGAFGLIGRSPAMERVFELIERLAGADVPVLIVGESGTGKELVAKALHEYGARAKSDMVSVNCAALPQTLLESELFGHVRGSFTGADRDRRGLFEVASGGSLFLDEIGDTPPRMQAGLLRALQEGVIRRVGAAEDIAVDVRLIAATNRDLEALVAEGSFREDLYYRLNVVSLAVPPLRERTEDIALLAEHFLAAIGGRPGVARKTLSKAALRRLTEYDWPGNVRQLEHALTNAAVMSDGDELLPEDFDIFASRAAPMTPVAPLGPGERKDRERTQIVEALEACGWNKSKAARMLRMPRRTFYRRLADYEIR